MIFLIEENKEMYRIVALILSAITSAITATAAVAGTVVYVPMGSGNEILIIDAATDTIKGRITDVSEIHGLAGVKGGEYLVAGSFTEFDADKSSAPPKPKGVSEDEHRAHHSKSEGSAAKTEVKSFISVIRVADGKVVRRITVPGAVHHVALTPDGKYAVATHPGQDAVSVIDLANFTIVKTLKTGSAPNYAAVSRDGRWAYVSNAGDNTVSVISTESWSISKTLRTGETPEHLVLAADDATLFVANIDDGTVSAIPLKDDVSMRTYRVGGLLHGIDLSGDGRTLFVSATEENNLVAIELASGQIKSVPVKPPPYHLATITGTGKLYLSSADKPWLWVIDQATLSVRRKIEISGKGHQMVVLNR